jgi:hypothetical protein
MISKGSINQIASLTEYIANISEMLIGLAEENPYVRLALKSMNASIISVCHSFNVGRFLKSSDTCVGSSSDNPSRNAEFR